MASRISNNRGTSQHRSVKSFDPDQPLPETQLRTCQLEKISNCSSRCKYCLLDLPSNLDCQ